MSVTYQPAIPEFKFPAQVQRLVTSLLISIVRFRCLLLPLPIIRQKRKKKSRKNLPFCPNLVIFHFFKLLPIDFFFIFFFFDICLAASKRTKFSIFFFSLPSPLSFLSFSFPVGKLQLKNKFENKISIRFRDTCFNLVP